MEKMQGLVFWGIFVLLTHELDPNHTYREHCQFTLSLLGTTELSLCQGDK